MRQGTKQLADTIPHDLHPDTNQQERSEFYNHIRSSRTEQEGQPIRKGVAEIIVAATKAEAIAAAIINRMLPPRVCGSFAPKVMATEIEPGPTVKGSVSG